MLDNDIAIHLRHTLDALKLIKDRKEDQGKIECPKCKGDLNYTRASSNGHVWGKCTTVNFLSWMQ